MNRTGPFSVSFTQPAFIFYILPEKQQSPFIYNINPKQKKSSYIDIYQLKLHSQSIFLPIDFVHTVHSRAYTVKPVKSNPAK
jgi:hypothetical protein